MESNSSNTELTERLVQELEAMKQELALAKERADAQAKEVEAAKAQAAQAAAAAASLQAAARQEERNRYIQHQQMMQDHYSR